MAKKTVAAKKRNVKVDANGQLHVHSSFNNIIVSLANSEGQIISWSSAGKMGFRGSKKNTPYAAQMNKRGEIALTYVYGIGRSSSAKILDKAGVDKDLKVKDWTDDQAAKIREIIGAEYKVEGDLRSEIQLNIKRLMDIGCYRGVRHRIGLPVRGQSTKNNARTRKGRKKTVANKKKATK